MRAWVGLSCGSSAHSYANRVGRWLRFGEIRVPSPKAAPWAPGCYRTNYLQGFENIGGGWGVLIKWLWGWRTVEMVSWYLASSPLVFCLPVCTKGRLFSARHLRWGQRHSAGESRFVVSHPFAKNAKGWAPLLRECLDSEKLRVRHPPSVTQRNNFPIFGSFRFVLSQV